MAADLGRLVATLEARAERFDLTLQRATDKLSKIATQTEQANARMARSSQRLESVASGVGRAFSRLSIAVAAGAAAVAVFARQQFVALDRLGDLSQQTGIAASELRQLQVALELNGGTAEQASEGLLTFQRNLGQVEAGTGRLTGLLKKLDPAFLANLKSAGSTSEAFRLYADRIAGARSEQEALALATAAFGGAGRQFVLLMRDGAAGVDRLTERLAALGVSIDSRTVAAVQELDDRLRTLRAVVTTQLTNGLFGVGEGLDSISDALDDETIRRLGELSAGLGQLVVDTIDAAKGIFRLTDAIEEFNRVRAEGGGILDATTAAALAGESADYLNARALEAEERVASLRAQLSSERLTGKPLDIQAQTQRQIELALIDLEQLQRALTVASARGPFVGPPEPRAGRTIPDGLPAPGARAPEAASVRAFEAAARERDRIRTEEYQSALRGFKLEADAADALVKQRTDAAERINAAWQEATLDRVSMLELEREAALRNVEALFQGSAAEIEQLQAKINETFDKQIDAVVTPFEARLNQLGEFGEQVFGDMVEGWVQGSEVSFAGILQSFAAMLIKMEAEALAADIVGAITGKGSGGTGSLVGSILLGLGNLVVGGGGGGSDVAEFAHGGIVTRPTRALIGEAGPEAVIPLPNGLRAMGGGMTTIINVQPPPGVAPPTVRRSRGPSMEYLIDIMFVGSMARQMRTNGPVSQAMQPDGPQSGLR